MLPLTARTWHLMISDTVLRQEKRGCVSIVNESHCCLKKQLPAANFINNAVRFQVNATVARATVKGRKSSSLKELPSGSYELRSQQGN